MEIQPISKLVPASPGLFVKINEDYICEQNIMTIEVKDTRFDEFLEFPCSVNFKVLGVAVPELVDHIVVVLQEHAKADDYNPQVRPSSKGNYHSVSVAVTVTSKEHMELLYTELGRLELVRYVI
jgi:hypothetical protein